MTADDYRREAIAEDPLLAPTLRARTAEVDKKLNALRLQFIFMFMFLVAMLIVMVVFLQSKDSEIRYDRHLSCVTRVAEITTWNAQLPEGVPHYPPPACPPDPYAD